MNAKNRMQEWEDPDDFEDNPVSHVHNWDLDPNIKKELEKIPLDSSFYMEGVQAVSLQGDFAVMVDDFEFLLNQVLQQEPESCPHCGGDTKGERHICRPLVHLRA